MVWSIDFTPRAAKSFRKLDKPIQKEIRNFLREVSGSGESSNRVNEGLVAMACP